MTNVKNNKYHRSYNFDTVYTSKVELTLHLKKNGMLLNCFKLKFTHTQINISFHAHILLGQKFYLFFTFA